MLRTYSFYLIEEAKNCFDKYWKNINEIAYSLGFGIQYFNKLFKKTVKSHWNIEI
jgi:YesN/AraC family two-component response regulator